MDESIGTSSLDDKQNQPADIVILDQHIAVTSNAGVQVFRTVFTFLKVLWLVLPAPSIFE